MTEKEIKVIDDMLNTAGEPLINVLLWAVAGLEAAKEKERQAGIICSHRDKHDARFIDAMRKAQFLLS